MVLPCKQFSGYFDQHHACVHLTMMPGDWQQCRPAIGAIAATTAPPPTGGRPLEHSTPKVGNSFRAGSKMLLAVLSGTYGGGPSARPDFLTLASFAVGAGGVPRGL